MTTKPFKTVCTECGGENVQLDAFVRWNTETQSYDDVNVMDKGHYCDDCDGECSVEDIELEVAEDPTRPTDRSKVGVICLLCEKIIPESHADTHCNENH